MTRMLFAAVGVAAVAVLAYFAMAWVLQRRIMFPAPPSPQFDAAAGIAGVEKIRIGDDRPVEAWFMPPRVQRPSYPAMIFAHGNGELIDHWVAEFEVVRDWGFGVLLVEYPGYGRSDGVPTQTTVGRALLAGYDYLVSRPDVRGSVIVGYGRSLGGGAICQLASSRPLAAMILESTFSSVTALARSMGVPGWLVRDPFDNLAVLREYRGPVLLLHGRHDRVIPFRHVEVLHREAPRSTLEPIDCGHNDCPRPWARIRGFLEDSGIPVRAAEASSAW